MDFSTFDLGKMKNMARKGIDKARQIAEGLNELEMKVEEATNNDKWGPHGSLMSGAQRCQRVVGRQLLYAARLSVLHLTSLPLSMVRNRQRSAIGVAAESPPGNNSRAVMQRSQNALITAKSINRSLEF